MTSLAFGRTLGNVDTTGLATARVAALAFVLAAFATTTAARADQQILNVSSAPIVRVNISAGDVTIRTWDRSDVGIEGDPSLSIDRRTAETNQNAPIAIPQIEQNTAAGAVALPPESFVTATIRPGPHDVVVVKSAASSPRAPVTVTVPNDTAFVYARAAAGRLDVSDYRGTLVALTRGGRMTLSNVGGTVFAQTWRGALVARGSAFDRIRARSLFGNLTFERCDARQIEVTTIDGSIVYDGGTFAAGLARFESTNGNVAIGATGNVQYGAHATGDGRIYTNFVSRAQVDQRANDTSALVGDGGPLVTATTQGGSVFLYDGSIRTRPQLPPAWQPAVQTLWRPEVPAAGVPARLNGPASLALPRLDQRRAPRLQFTPPPAFRRFRHE